LPTQIAIVALIAILEAIELTLRRLHLQATSAEFLRIASMPAIDTGYFHSRHAADSTEPPDYAISFQR
jgi:hypothetical protein